MRASGGTSVRLYQLSIGDFDDLPDDVFNVVHSVLVNAKLSARNVLPILQVRLRDAWSIGTYARLARTSPNPNLIAHGILRSFSWLVSETGQTCMRMASASYGTRSVAF